MWGSTQSLKKKSRNVLFVSTHVRIHVWQAVYSGATGQLTWKDLFSPFIVWVPEIERRSSGLLAGAFTRWDTLLALQSILSVAFSLSTFIISGEGVRGEEVCPFTGWLPNVASYQWSPHFRSSKTQTTYSPKLSSAEAGKNFQGCLSVGGGVWSIVRLFIVVILIVAAVVGYPVQGLAIPPDLSDCSEWAEMNVIPSSGQWQLFF